MPVELRHPPNVPGLLTIRDGPYYSVAPETLPPRLVDQLSRERVDIGRDVFRLAARQRHVHPGVRIRIATQAFVAYLNFRAITSNGGASATSQREVGATVWIPDKRGMDCFI